MKHRVALAGVFAAILVTSACGGGGAPSSGTRSSTAATSAAAAADADPVEWTGTFCTGIGPSIEGVLKLLQTMFEGGAEDPALQKTALLDYTDQAGRALSEAGGKLDDLGAPAGARALHDELVAFFTDSGKSLAKVNTELAALDPNDPEFAAKLERLGGDQADPAKLTEQVEKIREDPELAAAYQQAPECVTMAEKLKSLGA